NKSLRKGTHYSVPGDDDPRSDFRKALSYWQSVLHPDLASLAPMLSKMFIYVRPEWAYRSELNPKHVHEALMRLLLAEIIRLGENDADISLAIGVRRMPDLPRLPRTNMASRSGNGSRSFSRPSHSLGPQRNTPAKARPGKTGSTKQPTGSRSAELQTFSHSQPLRQPEPGSNTMTEGAPEEPTTRVQLRAYGESLEWQRGTWELRPPGSQTSGEKV
ncbi:hypothetical protein FRC11_006172, partial [Ceratobasidium sp. 423]